MEQIAKTCATCGWSFINNSTPKMPAFEPEDCAHCAMAKDAQWREYNAEFRAEMAREMMAKFERITQ